MMEENKINLRILYKFYDDLDQINPFLLVLYIILSFGCYVIYWIYFLNVKLEQIDDNAPESKRCAVILFVFPFMWAIINIALKYLFYRYMYIITPIKTVGWGIITFLSLQYIFDFCKSYGKITNTSGLLWYLLIYPGYFSVILLLFGFYYTFPLIASPLITIPFMQSKLNENIAAAKRKELQSYFNYLTPEEMS